MQNPDDEQDPKVENEYACKNCGNHWFDYWECAVDDDCPTCGVRNVPTSTHDIDWRTM